MQKSTRVSVTDQSRVAEARRLSAELARAAGFDETQRGKVSVVVTELASNIIKHAGHGELAFRTLTDEAVSGLEILAIDKGPGMQDVSRCLEDGYSTAGSPGTGLGAVKRFSNICEFYSQPGKGTVVLSRIWPQQDFKPQTSLQIGLVCVPKESYAACGDASTARFGPTGALILVADGLGHGPLAASAADEAVRVFRESTGLGPAEILKSAHGPLRATRGAAMSVAEISFTESIVRFAGIGNVSGNIFDGVTRRSLVSNNGTVGHEMHVVREFSYPWTSESVLVMHTDGLTSRWSLESYSGLLRRHAAIIAGVLYRDFARGNDDATVLVAKQPG